MRLVAGTGVDVHSGFLQIYFNGLWGTVCLDQFTDKAARVVCRQLGYANGSVLAAVIYPSLDGVIWLDDVQCLSGEEGNLDECSHAPWGIHDCVSEHVLDVAVQCWNGEQPSGWNRTSNPRAGNEQATLGLESNQQPSGWNRTSNPGAGIEPATFAELV